MTVVTLDFQDTMQWVTVSLLSGLLPALGNSRGKSHKIDSKIQIPFTLLAT